MVTDTDLTECDKEPIHIPSAIQPHGFFIAVLPLTNQIVAVSENIDNYFTFSAQAMIGSALEVFFPVLSEWAATEVFSVRTDVFALPHTRETSRFSLTAHHNGEYVIIEGEPAQQSDLFPEYLAQNVIQEAISLSGSTSVEELCRLGVLSLQRLSGFGRVMVYEFDSEYNGCVTAEATIPEMHSYLDHHFPSTDIPVQARELYKRNLIRFIPTATYEPVALQSLSSSPIDMSQSTLRSVSPVHLEYLRNMDVSASMSLSIIVKGELWGLFACHHPKPISLSTTTRRYCEMFIRLFNALIQEKTANESAQSFFRLKDRQSALLEAFTALTDKTDIGTAFESLGQLWLEALESDGAALLYDNQINTIGETLEIDSIKTLSNELNPLHSNDLYASSSINEILSNHPVDTSFAGVLSLIISHTPRIEIIWFRKEWVRDLKWAGKDDKRNADSAQRINPRLSFETLIVQQRGKSRPWNKTHLMIAEHFKELTPVFELVSTRQVLDRQQQLLIQQGKKAMMGEMIDAIAHQWNQPLNALSLLISGLSELIETSDKEIKNIEEIKNIGMARIRFMSETVDAFRNFFKPDRKVSTFSMMFSIKEVSDQLLPQIKRHQIQLILDESETVLYGHPNEFKQVILNLLGNACELLVEKNVSHPWIRCSIKDLENYIQLDVCDNGGGIRSDILEKIFTPYVSTKEEEKGRGIGLYLSKLIIEEHFNGTITAANTAEGACFTLSLPKIGKEDEPSL